MEKLTPTNKRTVKGSRAIRGLSTIVATNSLHFQQLSLFQWLNSGLCGGAVSGLLGGSCRGVGGHGRGARRGVGRVGRRSPRRTGRAAGWRDSPRVALGRDRRDIPDTKSGSRNWGCWGRSWGDWERSWDFPATGV